MSSSRHYQGESGRAYHEGKRGLPEAAFPWVARLRAEKFREHIKPTDVIFEFGVGAGWNLAELPAARRIGFDVADFLESTVRSRGIEFLASLDQLADHSVDVVLCHHALEHVTAPHETLLAIRRLLRPDGKLLLHVPFERERRYRHFNRAEPNHHLYSWNVQTLGNLVEEAGFAVHSAGLGLFGYDRFAAVQALKLRLGEPGFRLIRRAIHLVKPAWEVRVTATPSA